MRIALVVIDLLVVPSACVMLAAKYAELAHTLTRLKERLDEAVALRREKSRGSKSSTSNFCGESSTPKTPHTVESLLTPALCWNPGAKPPHARGARSPLTRQPPQHGRRELL